MPDVMRAILYMVLAMLFFTAADLFVKLASSSLSSGMITSLMGFGTALCFLIGIRATSGVVFSKAYLHWTLALRNFGEAMAALGMIISLSLVDLSTVTAILQSQPLLLTAAGALFLSEKVGIRRAMAVLIGFVGVLIILRPTQDSFALSNVVVLVAVIGMTIRDVGSRQMPSHIPTFVAAFYGGMAIGFVGLATLWLEGVVTIPQGGTYFYTAAMIITGAAGVYLITNAMRLGAVSVVSPFRYVKIIFGIGAGVLVLGERPDIYVLIGSAIVTAAGLYAFMRERHLLRVQTKRVAKAS